FLPTCSEFLVLLQGRLHPLVELGVLGFDLLDGKLEVRDGSVEAFDHDIDLIVPLLSSLIHSRTILGNPQSPCPTLLVEFLPRGHGRDVPYRIRRRRGRVLPRKRDFGCDWWSITRGRGLSDSDVVDEYLSL